jgi:hypothetical protein
MQPVAMRRVGPWGCRLPIGLQGLAAWATLGGMAAHAGWLRYQKQ